jgi:microsomal dipeptidase-like Zn-dependent dipeptidase
MIKKIITLLLALLIIGALYFFGYKVSQIDRDLNAVIEHAPYAISFREQALHDSLFIADLHADTLLWRRDPAKRHNYGQTDLPRLREGGVNLQVFATVTKSPRGLNFDNNAADAPDDITLLAKAQLWPPRTWNSLYERAAFQAERLHKLEANPANKLKILRRKSDLETPEKGLLLGLLATEGAHPLEGDLENIDRLYDAGFRMMGLQHFFDNKLGGSLHGVKKGGLTAFGRDAVRAMAQKKIIIDVAHSSYNVVQDVLAVTDKPVIISHGGIRGGCTETKTRNLPDEILKQIAQRRGLIGIAYFNPAICNAAPSGIAKSIIRAVNLLGEDVIALGSDFDGSVHTHLDTSELAAITQALRDQGLEARVIRKIMGGNVKRFLLENLPEGGAD